MKPIYTLETYWDEFQQSIKSLKTIWKISKWLTYSSLFTTCMAVCFLIGYTVAQSTLNVFFQGVIVMLIGALFALSWHDFVYVQRRTIHVAVYQKLSEKTQRKANLALAEIRKYFTEVSDQEIRLYKTIRTTMIEINNSPWYYQNCSQLLNWSQYHLIVHFCQLKSKNLTNT